MPRPSRQFLQDDGPQANLLLVEGADDFHVLLSLLDSYELRHQFRVRDGGGYETMHDAMDTHLDESGLERIAYVIDADEDITSRWQSFRNVLISKCGYENVPNNPNVDGTIIKQADKVTVGIWLMPNNTLPGALEDFIGFLVPPNDLLLDYAKQCVENRPVKSDLHTTNWTRKAEMHTWLALQKEPGKPMGHAITKRYLDPHAQSVTPFIKWIKQLFELPE